MKKEKEKQNNALNIISSIIVGTISAAATFFVLILIFFSIGLFGWSDGGEKEYLDRLEMTTNITFIISILIAVFVGIYVIYRMNKVKRSDNLSSHPDTPSQQL